MDVQTAAGQLAANFLVATPARILFERAARAHGRNRLARGVSDLRSRLADGFADGGRSTATTTTTFLAPFSSIWSVLTGHGDDPANGLLHVAHASLWTLSVPFIQASVIESAKDYLFVGYTQYGRLRQALDPNFRPYLFAEIIRPVTFAASTIAYAASFPFFLCAYGVRSNKPEHWNKIPASFLPTRKKAVPLTAIPLFILIAHLNSFMLSAGGMRDLLFRLRARLFPSTLSHQPPSPHARQLLRHVEDLILCLATSAVVVPLEVLLCTMLSTRGGLVASASAIWSEKGLGGFFNGFGWFLLAQYLSGAAV